MIHISAFVVPPGADPAFLAAWEGPGTLYRALRDDADFRYVEIGGGPDAYEVVREDGTPDVDGGVVLIEPIEVEPADDERFVAGWDRARAVLGRQRGYLGRRLHRSAGPAAFRFVAVARWSSPLMLARARQRPEFRDAAAGMPFPSHPALYQPVSG